jgi:hypothetical protein
MRQETNNEMDLLLRRLGRRQDVFAPDADDHLDADELSAYAEDALPVAARSRYTEHLADCSKCRELVVQLSASTGVVGAAKTTTVLEPSGWKKFLASLFSPMVLRYAAPALGLIVVAAIGVMVMRRNSPSDYVSQVQDQRVQAEKVAASPEAKTFSYATSPADTTANTESRNKSLPQREVAKDLEKPAAVEQNAPAPTPASQPVAAAAPPPAPAKVEATTDEVQRRSDDAKPKQQEAEVKVASSDVSKKNFEEGKNEVKRAEEPPASRGRTAKTKSAKDDAASPQTAGTASAGGFLRDGIAGADKDSREVTRSVAGRRFRQQGGIWIDTAYDSSRETMYVARDSERYRALIADEPAIKTIADTLSGDIIVVWKGRPYRIH